MAGETIITVVGNLTADPELRFTPSGAPVANFTVASTPRTLNRRAMESARFTLSRTKLARSVSGADAGAKSKTI